VENGQDHEPDVTPLINVNLVILVMALLVASHAALLLPLALPSAAETAYVKAEATTVLKVEKDSTYSLGERAGMTREDLAEAIAGFKAGHVIMLDLEPGAKYDALAYAVDCLMKVPDLRVGLGTTGAQLKLRPGATSAPAGGEAP
jgi:biopolymer transport protein ExbD